MNNIAKLIASIAALIAALTLAGTAYRMTNGGKYTLPQPASFTSTIHSNESASGRRK
jgi:hypothetical protein